VSAQGPTTTASDVELDGRRASDSSGGLVAQAVEKASRLITFEVQLAKQEIAEAVKSGVVALFGGVVAIFGAIAFLVMAVVTVVTAVSLPWAAALGFAVLFLVVAAAGAALAVRRMKRISPLRQTMETLKEDATWAKQQLTRDAK